MIRVRQKEFISVLNPLRQYENTGISAKRADKADFVLGVYKGIVKIVLKPTSEWQPVDVSDDGTKFPKTRYMVDGEILIDSPYLGKSVEAYPFGLGGAVTYIPRDIKQW